MPDLSPSTGAELGKKGIRFIVSVIGLLLLKAVVGALPMLKNAPTIGDTLMTPMVLADSIADTLIVAAILAFGLAVSRALRAAYRRAPDLSEGALLVAVLIVVVLAYTLYQVPIACVLISPQDLLSIGTGGTPSGGAQFGAQFGAQLEEAMRQLGNSQLPGVIKESAGLALQGYQRLAVVKLRESPDYYGWFFLLLAAGTVLRIVVLGARNLDTMSDLIFHKAQAAGSGMQQDWPSREQGWSPQNIDKLSRLKSLVDTGVITQADFDEQKHMLLYGSRPAVTYYILRAGQQYGPYTTDDLQTHLQQGAVLHADLARTATTREWVPLSQLLQAPSPAPPPPLHPQAAAQPAAQPEFQRLKQLLDAGALTQEEYETQKRRLLAQL